MVTNYKRSLLEANRDSNTYFHTLETHLLYLQMSARKRAPKTKPQKIDIEDEENDEVMDVDISEAPKPKVTIKRKEPENDPQEKLERQPGPKMSKVYDFVIGGWTLDDDYTCYRTEQGNIKPKQAIEWVYPKESETTVDMSTVSTIDDAIARLYIRDVKHTTSPSWKWEVGLYVRNEDGSISDDHAEPIKFCFASAALGSEKPKRVFSEAKQFESKNEKFEQPYFLSVPIDPVSCHNDRMTSYFNDRLRDRLADHIMGKDDEQKAEMFGPQWADITEEWFRDPAVWKGFVQFWGDFNQNCSLRLKFVKEFGTKNPTYAIWHMNFEGNKEPKQITPTVIKEKEGVAGNCYVDQVYVMPSKDGNGFTGGIGASADFITVYSVKQMDSLQIPEVNFGGGGPKITHEKVSGSTVKSLAIFGSAKGKEKVLDPTEDEESTAFDEVKAALARKVQHRQEWLHTQSQHIIDRRERKRPCETATGGS